MDRNRSIVGKNFDNTFIIEESIGLNHWVKTEEVSMNKEKK